LFPGAATAGLLHAIDWSYPSDELQLSQFIKIRRTKDSQVLDLYHSLCAQQQVDDGDPYLYDSYVLIQPDGESDNINCGDPYCLLDRVCNVIAVILAHPIPMCRVILSNDAFNTSLRTYEIFNYGMQTEFLMKDIACIDREKGAEIKEAWAAASALWRKQKSSGRVNSALTYFYYAWRSPYLDQSCLNLSVCLELLFTPHSQGEASHQISFNVARFLGSSQNEMKSIYRAVRSFYSIRSRIVHGGIPDEGKVIDAAIETFKLTSDCLRKILCKGFSNIFDQDSRRRELLSTFMFG
jgi:hypothetical protein